MSQRYTIFPSKDNKTGVLRYAFKDEKADANKPSNDRMSFGTSLYSYDNGLFLIIENAADAITVCALLNHIEKNTASL
jgi:hypothetical protein